MMSKELYDTCHPEHYKTRMPEQEYLGRFYGTFDSWTQIDCSYNFEVRGYWPFSAAECASGLPFDKTPFDYGEAHEVIRQGGSRAAVLHFSGTWGKPWDLLF